MAAIPESMVEIPLVRAQEMRAEITALKALVSEVVAAMDADDYWELTEMYPRLLAASGGSSTRACKHGFRSPCVECTGANVAEATDGEG